MFALIIYNKIGRNYGHGHGHSHDHTNNVGGLHDVDYMIIFMNGLMLIGLCCCIALLFAVFGGFMLRKAFKSSNVNKKRDRRVAEVYSNESVV